MEMSPEEYQQYVHRKAKKSPIVKDTVLAFVIGGLICVLGQAIRNGWSAAGLNLYNKIARFGGAGTLVPITGFANAVVSPAIDFKSEGFVTGMAARMFTVAGPVIVFGTAASVVYGIVLMVLGRG